MLGTRDNRQPTVIVRRPLALRRMLGIGTVTRTMGHVCKATTAFLSIEIGRYGERVMITSCSAPPRKEFEILSLSHQHVHVLMMKPPSKEPCGFIRMSG
jgi:hypothetical protein